MTDAPAPRRPPAVLRALLLVAIVAACVFVMVDREAAGVGGFSPDASEISASVPAVAVRHVPLTPLAIVATALPLALLVRFVAFGLAPWGAAEGRRPPRAERWVRRRGPPLRV